MQLFSQLLTTLETRVADLGCTFLDAPEEVAERLIAAAHRGLRGREIEASVIGVRSALGLEPAREVAVVHRRMAALPGMLFPFKAGVVQTPVRFQGSGKLALLVGVREQAVFEGALHLLALLIGDVTLHGGYNG